MKLLKKVNSYFALGFVAICLLQVLIFPRDFLGFLDNLLFVFAVLFVLEECLVNKESRQISVAFLIFFLWTFVSQYFTLYGNSWLSNFSSQLILLKMACILIVSRSLFEKSQQAQNLRTIIDGIFILIVIVNLIIAYNPMGIGESIQHLYTASNYVDFVYYHEPGVFRLAGTQLNPNNNAIVFLCFGLYYLQFLKDKWALFILAIGMLLLTQSRTNVIALSLCLLIYFIFQFGSRGNWKQLIYFGIPVTLGGLLFVVKSSYLQSIFTGKAFASHSFLVRLENYMYLSDFSFFELIIGKGVINKPIETLGFSMDSEFLGVIFQFGIIGLLCWLGILITLLKWNRDKNQLVLLLILSLIINSFTNLTLLNLQIGVVFVFFLAISLQMKRLAK